MFGLSLETIVILAFIGTPGLTSVLCIISSAPRWATSCNVVGSLLFMGLGLATAMIAFGGPARLEFFDLFYLDALSGFVLLIVSLVGGLAALYSVAYLRHDIEHGQSPARRLRWYYFWFHQAIFTMALVCIFNNLGLMWAAIEGTTLTTAFLVAFYQKKTSLEAAWKYLIIGTVGITFSLFGVLLAYASSVEVLGEASDALNWTTLINIAHKLDPQLVQLAFAFVIVGYGTKAGLAPMHTWLPDAHSQAPSPVSALLSGVLLNCALYAVLRYHILTTAVLGPEFSSHLLLLFGLFSIVVAVPFIMVQRDLKRLLAYSSIEHIGIISLAVGIGGPLAIFGAMLHMLIHALTKAMLFFTAGSLGHRYGSLSMSRIRGVLEEAPALGWLLLLGVFAICGAPPFAMFVSEFTIIAAGFDTAQGWVSVTLLAVIAFVFAGFLFHVGGMAFGHGPRHHADRPHVAATTMFGLGLALPVMGFGIYLPGLISAMITQVTHVFKV